MGGVPVDLGVGDEETRQAREATEFELLVAEAIDDLPDEWLGRTMLVRKGEMLPVECVARG